MWQAWRLTCLSVLCLHLYTAESLLVKYQKRFLCNKALQLAYNNKSTIDAKNFSEQPRMFWHVGVQPLGANYSGVNRPIGARRLPPKGVIKAETCRSFRQTIPTASSGCILNSSAEPECYTINRDLGCGKGVAFIEYTNCKEVTVPCCKPCLTSIMPAEDCEADYCDYGRLPADKTYHDKNCEYKATEWSSCHYDLLKRRREDPLVKQTAGDPCPPVYVIEKVCNVKDINGTTTTSPNSENNRYRPVWPLRPVEPPINCFYGKSANWSSCDPMTQTRTLQRYLDVNASSPGCKETETEVRPCFTKKGKERCFYTKWSRWSQCQNYIQRRERHILYGKKANCQKTVKVRTCTPEDVHHKRHRLKKVKQG